MTDSGGQLLAPCSGENRDLGEWRLDTGAEHREMWRALATRRLDVLIAERGEADGWRQYGDRLGNFLVRASQVFQLRSIVLSSGIAHAGGQDLDVVGGELRTMPDYLVTPGVMLGPFREAGCRRSVGAGSGARCLGRVRRGSDRREWETYRTSRLLSGEPAKSCGLTSTVAGRRRAAVRCV